jgi:hypothetical protein
MRKKGDNLFANFFNSMNGGGDDGDGEDDIIDAMDYSEDDKELLKAARKKEREEQKKRTQDEREQAQQQQQQQSSKEKDGNSGTSEEDDDDDDDDGGDVLVTLKNKIKLLQYQLKCQQVNALKTLNSEIISLQFQLIEEFQTIPLYSSLIDLLNEKMKSFRQNTKQIKTLPSVVTTTSVASSSSQKGSTTSTEVSNNIKECLFSFIAECIDNSLFLFRNALMASSSSASTSASATVTEEERKKKSLLKHQIHSYFHWMFITLLNGENVYDILYQKVNNEENSRKKLVFLVKYLEKEFQDEEEEPLLTEAKETGASVEEELKEGKDKESLENDESKETEEKEQKKEDISSSPSPSSSTKLLRGVLPKIGLFPDYRSKLFYFGSLVDLSSIYHIIQSEFPIKLNEIIEEWNETTTSLSILQS